MDKVGSLSAGVTSHCIIASRLENAFRLFLPDGHLRVQRDGVSGEIPVRVFRLPTLLHFVSCGISDRPRGEGDVKVVRT